VASNGHTTQASVAGDLQAGAQQLVLKYPVILLATLGVDGPYTEANARLIFDAPTGEKMADFEASVGSTQAYALALLRQGYFYLTGQNSATPVDANRIPGFETLNISVGIPQQSGGACQGNADLYAGRTLLDSASFYGLGTDSITFSFNGYRIRHAALDGPYALTNVTIKCPGGQASGNHVFQTPPYNAAQFEAGVWDFSLSAPSSLTSVAPLATSIVVSIARPAGFNEAINFSVSGVPAGSTATVYFPTVSNLDKVDVVVAPTSASTLSFPPGLNGTDAAVSTSTPPGSYPLTITGVSGPLIHSVTVAYVVPR